MFELHQGRAQFFPYFVKVGIIYKPLVIYTLMHIHTQELIHKLIYMCIYVNTHKNIHSYTQTYIHT